MRNRILGRFSVLVRMADLLLVAGLLLRVAQRKGLISDQKLSQMGLEDVADNEPIALAEIALAGAAAYRLLRRKR